MPPGIPTYPVIHVNIAVDGSAHVNVAGRHLDYPPNRIEDSRSQIAAYAVEYAKGLGRAVRMTTVEPTGESRLAVFPNGDIQLLEPTAKRGRRKPAPTVAIATDQIHDLTVLAPPRPSRPTPPLPHRTAARTPVATFRFTTGDVAHVTDRAIIGREPEAARDAVAESWQQIEVIDTSKTMSRVHAEVTWSGDRLLLTDRGSGNGTTVRRPHGDVKLRSSEPFELRNGDTLIFGPVVSATLTITTRSTP